jgi:hypothetical protein
VTPGGVKSARHKHLGVLDKKEALDYRKLNIFAFFYGWKGNQNHEQNIISV